MSRAKILVVDDSRMSRKRFLAKPLLDAGYEVVEAVDGVDGLAAFDVHNPDVVISDLLMPNMDGFEFVGKLREKQVQQPIIVASADIQETTRQKVEALEVFGFLNKPYTSEVLLDAVSNALDSVAEKV